MTAVLAGDDAGQTIGIYIVAMTALFLLAFAFFAVGQASVARNSAQSAADAAALAAARESRDEAHDRLLIAVRAGDTGELSNLLQFLSKDGTGPCLKAEKFAQDNGAHADHCGLSGDPGGYTVTVQSLTSVGKTVVHGTEDIRAEARATAEVTSRCESAEDNGGIITFTCDSGKVTVDAHADDFALDLSVFYAVHLTS